MDSQRSEDTQGEASLANPPEFVIERPEMTVMESVAPPRALEYDVCGFDDHDGHLTARISDSDQDVVNTEPSSRPRQLSHSDSFEDTQIKLETVLTSLEKLKQDARCERAKCLEDVAELYEDMSEFRCEMAALLVRWKVPKVLMDILRDCTASLEAQTSDTDTWRLCKVTIELVWNFSDSSEAFAKVIASAGGVNWATENLKHDDYVNFLRYASGTKNHERYYMIVRSSLGILHNIAKCSGVRVFFVKASTITVVSKLTQHKDMIVVVLAMLLLAYIVQEEDAVVLSERTDAIQKLVEWTDKAMDNAGDHRFGGFSAGELIEGLTKLAGNDENKIRIVKEKGALPVLLRLLTSAELEEQGASAECIWMLAFNDEARVILKGNAELLQALESLQRAPQAAVRKNVQGALWMLRGDNQQERTSVSSRKRSLSSSRLLGGEGADTEPYIFLSYSWSEQALAKQLKEALTSAGYRVWIDVEQMGGSTLQSMAEGVEGAELVLICASERYQDSPNCRLEAEYTFTQKKKYIPVILQRKFRPSSWLGAMFGARLYFDFCGSHTFGETVQNLIKETKRLLRRRLAALVRASLQDYVEKSSGQGSNDAIIPTEFKPAGTGIPLQTTSSGASSPDSSTESARLPPRRSSEMTQSDVSQWLIDARLPHLAEAFSQFSGRHLTELRRMKDTAPEFLYSSLKSDLNLSLMDIVLLCNALSRIR